MVKKDVYQEKHSDELNIPNIEVIGLLRSFRSKGFVKETFSWQYYYYYLTEEGINYLRAYLSLPSDIVPATHKANPSKAIAPSGRFESGRRFDGGEGGDKKKNFGPGGDFKPEFGGRGGRDGYRGRERNE